MKKLQIAVVLGAVALAGCADDGGTILYKGEVDTEALADGVIVSLEGNIGQVEVPFETAMPDVEDIEIQDALDSRVSLVVVNPDTGASADLTDGVLVETPAGPGEYAWEIAEDRMSALIVFYNETPSGMNLTVGETYSAQLSIATNDYVTRLSAMTFQASVQ